MGTDYQWANVEEQQGDLCEWVGCRGDGEGVKVLSCSSMAHWKASHSQSIAGANPLICPAANRVHLWLSSLEIK